MCCLEIWYSYLIPPPPTWSWWHIKTIYFWDTRHADLGIYMLADTTKQRVLFLTGRAVFYGVWKIAFIHGHTTHVAKKSCIYPLALAIEKYNSSMRDGKDSQWGHLNFGTSDSKSSLTQWETFLPTSPPTMEHCRMQQYGKTWYVYHQLLYEQQSWSCYWV